MFNRTSLHIAMLLWGVIFSLIAALCMFMSKNFDKERRRWLLWTLLGGAVLLFNDVLAWGFRGVPGRFAGIAVHVSNFMVFVMSDFMLVVYHGYLCTCLFGSKANEALIRQKKSMAAKPKIMRRTQKLPVHRIRMVYLIAMTGIAFVILSQFTGLYYYIDAGNFYHRSGGHILSILIPVVGMLIDFSILIEWRKKVKEIIFVSLVSYIALPFAAAVALVFYYGISLTNIAISISIIWMFVVAVMEQNENLARKEQEAAQMRINMMLSQIAPHFIYNTLTSVQSLCKTDPEKAGETVGYFSEYLRGNLDSLSEREPVPFERELNHVRCYLAIEQQRFGDRVCVQYDIQDEDFLIPALTLQPIVENAVKHGLCAKEEGGTLLIRTQRVQNQIYIRVTDDGIGFDPDQIAEDDKVHIGLENVRSRLESMCQGDLQVRSRKGKGTTVEITLPQKWQ